MSGMIGSPKKANGPLGRQTDYRPKQATAGAGTKGRSNRPQAFNQGGKNKPERCWTSGRGTSTWPGTPLKTGDGRPAPPSPPVHRSPGRLQLRSRPWQSGRRRPPRRSRLAIPAGLPQRRRYIPVQGPRHREETMGVKGDRASWDERAWGGCTEESGHIGGNTPQSTREHKARG